MAPSWVSWVVVALAYISFVFCTPSQPIHKRQDRGGIVTGIGGQDENGNNFLRLDVRDMKANHPEKWNLYMLGLDQLHRREQSDPSSYYSLAEIHGRPYKTHFEAPGIANKVGKFGYCPHSMGLFLSWHRPYLALFEQVLHETIQALAEMYPPDEIDSYRDAAHSFRIPYWDWSQGDQSGGVPDFFMTETVYVHTPQGVEFEISNPLHRYHFRPVPEGFEGKWTQMEYTVRWPASEDPSEGSREVEFAKSFAGMQRQAQDQVAVAFRATDFDAFQRATEMVHGWIHGVVGGGYDANSGGRGHMWPLEYASYDPLFWLHHANIDRIFAIYQAKNPDASLGSSTVGSAGNVFVADHSVVDGDTPLLPFSRDSDNYWTTSDIMDWRKFGYDYADTQGQSTEQAQATVAQLFSGSARKRLADGQTAGFSLHSLPDSDDSIFTDWNIKAAAAQHHLPASFLVQFSLAGDSSSDASTKAGMWTVLMPEGHNMHMHKRAPCAEEKLTKQVAAANMTLHGIISLTTSLLDLVEANTLESLDKEDVVPFLTENLSWQLFSGDGVQLPDSSLNAISIEVYSQTARVPCDPKAPIRYKNTTVTHTEVTAGKLGGANINCN